ncbi:L-lactate dehydrogenase [Duganella ginsengisoli]|uniref:L-lactate dehydrogenase n=2 Tax=Pseudoduganella ginsengisoli TaxID=1462440 RepID=A0A6L6Q4G1_9BURK|nr:L-lactate dehydrogenase [Pseudoduganella ginsengisoli]
MKIGIVGAGAVGSTAAFALINQGIGSEIVLVDHNAALSEAQHLDLLHATPYCHPLRVRCGGFGDLQDCALVILAAGVSQAPGETRLQLLARNAAVFRSIVPPIVQAAPGAILLVATNPLDIMTHVAMRLSGLPPGRVIGTGTLLDSARFRALLAERLGVAALSVHAQVLGEHGDSEVLVWSGAQVAGLPLQRFAALQGVRLDDTAMAEIDADVRGAAYRIIEGKGATCYGIAAALAMLARCVLFDEKRVLTVSSHWHDIDGVPDVTLSMPVQVGADGGAFHVPPALSETEQLALAASARVIRDALAALGY